MASYDALTRQQLRELVERELMDTTNRWWSDAELNRYLAAWQRRVQEQHQLVWGTATITNTGDSTFALTDFAPDVWIPGRLIHNARLLAPITPALLEERRPQWRAQTSGEPVAVFQEPLGTLTVFPQVPATHVGTYVLEYPVTLKFTDDASPTQLPPFTQYSAKNYCGFRAFLKRGANYDSQRAAAYKQLFERDLAEYGIIKRKFLPKRFLQLRPGGLFEKRMAEPYDRLIPSLNFSGDVAIMRFNDEEPMGTVNGTNTVFTLSYPPSPPESLEFNVDGIELVQNTHYTLTGATVTLTVGAPVTGQTLFAHYRYLG